MSIDTFRIIFHSLLVLNNKISPLNNQVSLAALSSKISPAKKISAQRSYLYSVLYRGSRLQKYHLNNLLRLMRKEVHNCLSHHVIKEVRDYLHKYYWKSYRVKKNGYHKYWDRNELKFTLRKYLFDETLGLDINIFHFINLDLGDTFELHHIFENIESIFLKDLAPLLIFSHKSLTHTFETEPKWIQKCNTIFQRKKLLIEFSLLNYSKLNEQKIRFSFINDKLWLGMPINIAEQWVEKWKDKNKMKEKDWYDKYGFRSFYFRYINFMNHLKKISSLPNVTSNFVLWYFEYFIPNYL